MLVDQSGDLLFEFQKAQPRRKKEALGSKSGLVAPKLLHGPDPNIHWTSVPEKGRPWQPNNATRIDPIGTGGVFLRQ
jgi:hypothetical protein